ncbi:MAG: hydrogenase nickel incorporation protein HypA [Candidatus Cloacimonetes bacterium]|nr:hydrogenase nickel incorporation protein HypA [Candidatus Cloacimonadota bacterium]MBL7108236.1 hydrogenase nickel incorporation protein HypA [Candidatus Cloacimonadota bacterium]
MHEWALADAVVTSALKVAEKENLKKITKIVIKIGELQTIDEEIFNFALKEVIQPQQEILGNADIEIETEKAILKCRVCKNEWLFENARKNLDEDETESIHFIPETAHIYLRCPKCKSPDFEIKIGRGIWLDAVEGER